ncbi:hypothetical protein O6H91_17G053200 [Diphasiastrum complanatum]|uniref:Uncharacterized protein n=1 Tax=Diphasiastrum complanatum TaxID=34168 RepID=A0ACC2B7S3_DIPCM|nr:hypothetical protein O6H91_17G053200 [Diphasiastrum complanatum]
MKKAMITNVWHIILIAVLLALFLQVPIFYGVGKLSIISCNTRPTVGSVETFSPRRAGSSASVYDATTNFHSGNVQKRDIAGSQPNQGSASTAAVVSNFTRKQHKQSLRPHGHAHYPFVQFSAYRESPRVFFVIGITSVVARKFDHVLVYKCEWHPKPNGSEPSQPSKVTDAELMYVYFDQMPRIYVVAPVNCTFEDDVGMDVEEGGSLFMTVSVGPHPGDTERVLALQEQKGEAVEAMRNRDQPLPLKYAFCGPPMHGNIRAEWVLHWLVYHHYLWRDSVHFFFYNVGGITDSVRQVLSPFVHKGLLTILDVEDQKEYPSWYFNQLLFVNDCLHRTRYLSSWTFFHDFDEFLAISSPNTLDKLLDEYKDAPYLSFGSLRASPWICADIHPGSSEWPLQRMRWVEKQPYCCVPDQDPWLCIHGAGARKYAVNPRKVFAGGIHKTAIPEEGGVNLNASIARLHHYQGIVSNKSTLCSSTVNASMPLETLHQYFPSSNYYLRDDHVSTQIGKAREFDAELLSAYS